MKSALNQTSSKGIWWGYAVAAGSMLVALLVRFALDPWLGDHLPYVAFFVAVAAVVWHCRTLGPPLVAVILGAVAAEWFFAAPRYTWHLPTAQAQMGLATYFMVTLAFVGFGHALQRSRTRADVNTRDREQAEEERAALLEREREARAEAEALNEVARTVAAELDLQKLVQTVTDAATKLTGAKFGAFFYNVLNEQGEAYLLYTLSGAPREAFEKFGLPRATPLFGPTFHGQGVVRSDDISKHPNFGKMGPHHGMPKGHLPVRSYLAVPVASRSGEVLGALFFGHPDPGVFTERAERLTVGIAAQAAIAIDNARLFSNAQKEIEGRKQSEERFRSLVSVITDVPWTADAEGTFVTPQPAWAAYTGQTWEELRGFGWANALHPDDRERVKALWETARQSRTVYHSDGRLWHAASKQWRYFEARATPLLDPEGSVREWVGTCTDVHERKQTEEALREAHALLADKAKHLESLVQQRTAKLQEVIGEMEGFSYSVAHDVRAPLRAMQGYANAALDDQGSTFSPQTKTYLERIRRASARLDQLTQEVLSYTQLSREETKLRLVDLDKLAHDILEQYPHLCGGNQIQIASPLLPVLGQESLLMQALSNLLINSCKFIAPGTTPRVSVRTEDKGEHVRLWVEDNGIGIAPEHRDRIFTLFGRVHPENKFPGTGVGLMVVKKAAQKMGGTVGFESELNKGSRFWLELRKP